MMELETGWWTLKTTIEINDIDRQHIANLIMEGYKEGELIHEEGD